MSAFDEPRICVACKGVSRAVTRKTMLLMLKPEAFDRIGESLYRFCASAECRVVYFPENGGESFKTDDLRARVGVKEKSGPIPLCYCFGFDEAGMREEIEATGHTTIPQRIIALVKLGMCACDDRNPSGACCLGEVTKAAKRLMAEAAR